MRLHRRRKGDACRQVALAQVFGQRVKNQITKFLRREIWGRRGLVSSRRTEIAAHASTQPFEGFQNFAQMLLELFKPMLGAAHDFPGSARQEFLISQLCSHLRKLLLELQLFLAQADAFGVVVHLLLVQNAQIERGARAHVRQFPRQTPPSQVHRVQGRET